MKNFSYAGMIGCGDYLRWETEKIRDSRFLKVKYTYDLDPLKSASIAEKIGAASVSSSDMIFTDPEIEVVLIFTPPWARLEYFRLAAYYGKHIITTKPLAPNLAEAEELFELLQGKHKCSVFYGRAGDAFTETLKKVLDGGEIGHLALYKEDWLHHFPHWNNWATDPEKNGGPFMDAMIHNLNKARYLIGSEVDTVNFFSENYAQELACNDTEFMKVNFKNGAGAYLFITWAADLDIYSPDGNDREHYGPLHLVSSKGWYITREQNEAGRFIKAKKDGKEKKWKIEEPQLTPYDDFVECYRKGITSGHDIKIALEDIRIIEKAVKGMGGLNRV